MVCSRVGTCTLQTNNITSYRFGFLYYWHWGVRRWDRWVARPVGNIGPAPRSGERDGIFPWMEGTPGLGGRCSAWLGCWWWWLVGQFSFVFVEGRLGLASLIIGRIQFDQAAVWQCGGRSQAEEDPGWKPSFPLLPTRTHRVQLRRIGCPP